MLSNLMLMLQPVAPPAEPFFTDSLEGWAKVIGVFGGMLTAVMAALWKMMDRPWQEQVNGLGGRVDAVERLTTRYGAEITALKELTQTHTRELQLIAGSLGKIEQLTGTLHQAVIDAHAEIANLVHEASLEHSRELRQLSERQVKTETVLTMFEQLLAQGSVEGRRMPGER